MLRTLSKPQSWALGAAGMLSVLLVWQLGYSHTIFVPPPREAADTFLNLVQDVETWEVLWVSTRRLGLGLVLGLVLGLFTALLAGEHDGLRRMMNVYVQITFTFPSLLIGLLALVIFGISEVGVVCAVAVVVFPFIASPVMEGVKSLDKSMLAMAQVYGVSRGQRIRDVLLPHVAPFLFAGIRNGHALAWRVLIVTEIFSVRSGLGFKFQRAFDLFQFDEVMVYLVLMLTVIFIIEFGLLKPLETRSSRWRTGGRKRTRPQVSSPGPAGTHRLAANV